MRRVIAAGCWALVAGLLAAPGLRAEDWPMLAHDPARSSCTREQVDGPFRRAWYRDLITESGERTLPTAQPVIAEGVLYIGTMGHKMHAMDAATGKDVWSFEAGAGILHSAAAGRGLVFFGCMDGYVYALEARSGKLAWRHGPARGGFWNAPAVEGDRVYIGGRDGKMYCLDARAGKEVWSYQTGGPVLCSPAASGGKVFVGSEDMHGYALDARTGRLLWKSEKFHGQSMRSYFPVVAGDTVMFRTNTPGNFNESFRQADTMLLASAGFPADGFREYKSKDSIMRQLRKKVPTGQELDREQKAIVRWLAEEKPMYQSLYCLDVKTGRKRFVPGVLYACAGSGQVTPPPVAFPDGRILVLGRSIYSTWDEAWCCIALGTPGWMDPKTGRFSIISDVNGPGYDGNMILISDEPWIPTVGGRNMYIWSHTHGMGGFDLETRKVFPISLDKGVGGGGERHLTNASGVAHRGRLPEYFGRQPGGGQGPYFNDDVHTIDGPNGVVPYSGRLFWNAESIVCCVEGGRSER